MRLGLDRSSWWRKASRVLGELGLAGPHCEVQGRRPRLPDLDLQCFLRAALKHEPRAKMGW